MKVVVLGATGGTGKNVVERALAAGHEVVAVVRKPDAVPAAERLRVCKGDVLDERSLASAFAGADAVISAIGPASNSAPGTLLSDGARNMVAACTTAGVQRLVFESGMICSEGKELSLVGNLAVRAFRAIYPKLYADKMLAEGAVKSSGLDWVIVRPPTLNHAPATGKYVAGPAAPIFPGNSLPHADCADCLIRATTEAAWVRECVNVGRR